MWDFVVRAIDIFLPRHRDATLGRTMTVYELGGLVTPTLLPGKKWIHALLPYHHQRVRAAIKAVKYYGESSVAATLGTIAADYVIELMSEAQTMHGWKNIVVVPIPSSPKRLRERGYNQAARIAEAFAKNLDGVTYDPALLTREDRTSQVHVDRSRRKDNIKNAFAALPRAAGTSVILIDDVVESGATLADARRALLASGAKHVIAIALAH